MPAPAPRAFPILASLATPLAPPPVRAARPYVASLEPPGPLPASPPAGHVTRDLRFDETQDHPGFGLTVERVLRIFRAAEAGDTTAQCDLFDDIIENDGHLRDLIDHRSQVVAGKAMVIQAGGPDSADQDAAEALAASINRMPGFISFVEHLLGFNRYGWAATEIDWDLTADRTIAPVWLTNVPARRFLLHRNHLTLRTRDNAYQGELLAPGKWVVSTGKGPLIARAGLMRTAAWFALFKRLSGRDWSIYAEKFGLPFVWAEYDETVAEDAKQAAEDAVEHIGEDGSAVVSKGVDIHIEEAGRNGDATKVHGGMITHCNREMSKLVNGSTLTNDNGDGGGSSYALGRSHENVRHENIEYDVRRIESAFVDGIARPFVHFNSLPARPPLLRVQYYRQLSPGERIALAQGMTQLGIPVSRDQMRQETGFKPPVDDADAAWGAAPMETTP